MSVPEILRKWQIEEWMRAIVTIIAWLAFAWSIYALILKLTEHGPAFEQLVITMLVAGLTMLFGVALGLRGLHVHYKYLRRDVDVLQKDMREVKKDIEKIYRRLDSIDAKLAKLTA